MITTSMRAVLKAMKDIVSTEKLAEEQLQDVLSDEDVRHALVSLSRLPVFSHEFGSALKDDLDLLHSLKQLKYFWNLPVSQLAILMANVSEHLMTDITQDLRAFEERLSKSPRHLEAVKEVSNRLPAEVYAKYMENAAHLEDADPHAVYPTSIYRQCDAQTLATKDASTIEVVMSTTITTIIKIARKVLVPSNHLLCDVYKPLGRCVAVVDDKVEEHYGAEIDQYFAAHDIEFTKLVFNGNEVDKGIEDVERILAIVEKRGGNLCAPIPKPFGFSGYLNDLSEEMLAQRMREYKDLVSKHPCAGRGVEEHCVDVGLGDPQAKKLQKLDAGLAKLAAAKLDLLKELRDEGLLTDEQFDQKLQLHGPAA
ncbi:unnamed protein product [Symbiodinium sp. KB8]|nr:unnamed protein product [Symbiodinium sp. KB8]